MIRGIEPFQLKQAVKNNLRPNDDLDWRKVRDALEEELKKTSTFVNTGIDKYQQRSEQDHGNYYERDNKRRYDNSSGSRRHDHSGGSKGYESSSGSRRYSSSNSYGAYDGQRKSSGYDNKLNNNNSNQGKKPLMNIDVKNPPSGIDLSLDPTIKGPKSCVVCKGNHWVRDCTKASNEQKDWYCNYVRKCFMDKEERQKSYDTRSSESRKA